MKRTGILLLCALIMLSLTGCLPIRNPERDRNAVFDLVIKNESQLRAYIAAGDYSEPPKIDGIESVYANPQNKTLDFSCGGYGFGSSCAYFGFCYTADNDYTQLPFTEYTRPEDIVFDGHCYSYTEKDGDNTWNAEMITDDFWYYDASF